MIHQIQRQLGSGRHFFMVCGGVLLGTSLCGLPDMALASDRQIPLHVDSGRMTGQLHQVSLRTVLGQLQKQLGLDYVAPDAEMEKVISVRLQNEPLHRALSKILVQWDYAFTLNAAGKITTLHVMAKVSPEASLADKRIKSPGREPSGQKISAVPKNGLAGYGLNRERENQRNKNMSRSERQYHGKRRSGGQVFAIRNVPMEIRPPAHGASMPISPASSRDMPITPAGGSERAMKIIPPTAYPPMNIQPVPKHMQQEMLLPLSP
ncbi:hypothetical protein ACTRXD_20995 [Nitrospira sp. T9]|uniref:hypothetical protein n=1 Tax=unclassified Nitrospira TaxID=2652172 RepID=UPI003F944A06